MNSWRMLPSEQRKLYSPVGLRLVDRMTDQSPLGYVVPMLERSNGNGGWIKTDARSIFTPSGVITYPGLGRRAEVKGQLPQRYRIRLNMEFYRPLYILDKIGIEFDAYPYNDTNSPQQIASVQDVFLAPAINYPFPTHIPILRGAVLDQDREKVTNASVLQGSEHVITDERGEFALPLRWVLKKVPIPINASEKKTGKKGLINIVVPSDLGKNHIIIIN